MGLLRDAIGSALGANQANNGLSGPRLPFVKTNNRDSGRFSSLGYQQSPSPSQRYDSYADCDDGRNSPRIGYQMQVARSARDPTRQRYNDDRYDDQYQYSDEPHCYEQPVSNGWDGYQEQFYDGQPQDMSRAADFGQAGGPNFRPLALPQIGYGDGEPFLRGYPSDLRRYDISEGEFIGLLDAINVAIIPHPENQIFPKGANIAGWFL
ncbi:hypothetical protein PoHVEF18_007651 [Penicillium ochrochloron]